MQVACQSDIPLWIKDLAQLRQFVCFIETKRETQMKHCSNKKTPPQRGFVQVSTAQCALAAAAPMPVSERTCCASKPALSIAARGLLSVTEKNQMPKKPTAIEKIAGEV